MHLQAQDRSRHEEGLGLGRQWPVVRGGTKDAMVAELVDTLSA
jgi:hypothetical protein